ASGPDGVVAVFWDDFRSDTLGVPGVFTWYDEAGHRFVVEWSRCRHVHGFRTPVIAEEQTFEVILLDPQYHGTRTGDGPLLLQYQTVQNDDSLLNNCHNFATVGIQAPGRSDGIEYTFAGSYPAAAAVLGPGRAVKFTTNPPDTFTAVNGEPVRVPPRPRIEAWPNPAAGRVRLAVSTPAPARVSAYNAAGRLVWTSGVVPEGASDLPWNGRDVRGLSLPAGVYHVVLTAAGGYDRITAGERVLLLR
ncbi:hypothetical protein FJY71_09680, partial [candidate division WOR-3 bacterium]|nr:hypothetical protein [candidate division WOR-3 bacterium]